MIRTKIHNWYVAQLKPNCGDIAQRNLKRQGFTTFLPQREETQRRNGRFVSMRRPLFPGYLFVTFDPSGGNWRTINSTVGITKLLSIGSVPTSVPQGLITNLLLRCDDEGNLLPPNALQPGDQILVTTGPFANFVAEVESVAPDRRIWILMEIMGGQARVAMRREHLRAL